MVAKKGLQASNERLSLALEAAQLATFDWNVRTGEIIRDSNWFAMVGYDEAETEPDMSFWCECATPMIRIGC